MTRFCALALRSGGSSSDYFAENYHKRGIRQPPVSAPIAPPDSNGLLSKICGMRVAVAENKAHTAAVRRIARRYGAASPNGEPQVGPDVVVGDMTIDVETSATLAAGIARLQDLTGQRFIAVTNKESLAEAIALTSGTGIGVMDAQGEIVRSATEH